MWWYGQAEAVPAAASMVLAVAAPAEGMSWGFLHSDVLRRQKAMLKFRLPIFRSYPCGSKFDRASTDGFQS